MQNSSRPPVAQALRRLAPWVATALSGALLALLLQGWVHPTAPISQTVVVTATLAPPTPTPAPLTPTPPAPEATPEPATPTTVRLPSDTVSLEIITLRADLATTNGYLLIMKAASRVQEARFALANNDLPGVASQLAVAQEDLDNARTLVPDPLQGAILVAINDINYLRDDLSVRPEQIDERLSDLWETLTSLVDVQLPPAR